MKKIEYKGLTLVELLVGIVVGLVVLSAAGGAMISYIKSYNDNQKILNLNQNMRGVMDVMAREIRRAGYMSSDISAMQNTLPDTRLFKPNPFFNPDNDLAIHTYDGVENSCITFSYDLNKNLTVESSGPNERFGFRLVDKKIQMRKSGGGAGCTWDSNSYERITDDDILINKLNFKIEGSEGIDIDSPTKQPCGNNNLDAKNCLYVRSVRIELTASTNSEPKFQQTLVQTVKIRNDKFKPKTSP